MTRQGYTEVPSLAQAGSREQAQWAEIMSIQGLPPGTDVIYHNPISQMFHILPSKHHHLELTFQISEPVGDSLTKSTTETNIKV